MIVGRSKNDPSPVENRKSNETETTKSVSSPAPNIIQSKNIESYFNKRLKLKPTETPKAGKATETAEFGSSKNEKPEKLDRNDRNERVLKPEKIEKPEKVDRLPKLVPYTMDNPTDFEHWKAIINNLAKKEVPVPVVQPQFTSKGHNETMASPSIAPLELDRQPSQPHSTIQSRFQSPNIKSLAMPSLHPDLLNISTHSSQSEHLMEQALQPNPQINQVIRELRENPVDLFESVKDMEKSHAIKVLTDKVSQLVKEKEELKGIVSNLNTMLVMLGKKQQENEIRLVEEITYLKEYAAKNSEEKFQELEEENQRLRYELEQEREALLLEREEHRLESQQFNDLLVDIEETKKNIIEELFQIRFTKERLNIERKELEAERKELGKYKDTSSSQNQDNTFATRGMRQNTNGSNLSDEITIGDKAENTKRNDPLLLNLNNNNNANNNQNNSSNEYSYNGSIYQQLTSTKPNNNKTNDYIKIQNGNGRGFGFTDTEYENTSEDASGTFRERDMNVQDSSRMRDSRDYGSLSSRAEEETSNIKQLREMIKNLGSMNI